MEVDPTIQAAKSRVHMLFKIAVAVAIAAGVGLGTWLTSSYIRDSESVTPAESELTASQHVTHLVRALRISATSEATPPDIDTIPESVGGVDALECGTRYADALDTAVVQMQGIDYLSTVAGARLTDVEAWRTQQSQAHASGIALENLFPEECAPRPPVAFDLHDPIRNSDQIGISQILLVSQDLIEEWSQLYLLAENADQRDVALAGLWRVINWETAASPGRSPLTFEP